MSEDWRIKVYGGSVTGNGQRRRPKKSLRDAITTKQGGRCLYCELPIGTVVERRGNLVTLQPHWDHFVPYAYSRANPNQGWVLACHVCNGIKSGKVFTTVGEAQTYIRERWEQKGYSLPAIPELVGSRST